MRTAPPAVAIAVLLVASITQADLIGYWRFESTPDASGFGPDFLKDSGPNGLDLTNPGGLAGQSSVATSFSNPVPQTGAANEYHAFTLNNNQRLTRPDDPLFNTGDFTIEAMVQFGAMAVNQGLNADIASQWGGGGNNAWRFLKNGANQLSMGLSGNGFGFFTTGASFTFDSLTDYYVAAVVDIESDESTNVTFFVQDLTAGGPLQMITGSTGAPNIPGPLNNSVSDFVIGGTVATNDIAATRIDEVRLSSGLVSQSDLLIVSIPEPSAAAMFFGLSTCVTTAVGRRKR